MIVLDIPGRGRFEFESGARIGRDAAWADVLLHDDRVSRHHLEVCVQGSAYRIFDLHSRNGTSVNGRPVERTGRVLCAGDEIEVGGGVKVQVVDLTDPPPVASTVGVPASQRLRIELEGDQFVVGWGDPLSRLRDAMPFQLGLALTVLAQYRLDGLGPVPDADLRAVVWRGDADGQERGDINRLLHRLRGWFKDRDAAPPDIERPIRAGITRLELPPAALDVRPPGWIYRYLDEE